MNSMQHLIFNVKKARDSVVSRARTRSEAKRSTSSRHFPVPSSGSSVSLSNPIPTSSIWDVLPVELQVKIFAHCHIKDLMQLKLACRNFARLISSNEHAITRQYLRQLRHGTLPPSVQRKLAYTGNPSDDVVLLSDLFPPAASAKGGHIYTFRYIYTLQRRHELCAKLSYYLADRVMDRFAHEEPAYLRSMFNSRSSRHEFLKRSVARISFYLTPLMYYVLYFLESYSSARREQTNILLREFEAKRLPVPIRPNDRKSIYRDLQAKILKSPPFTNNATLVSTHHCMQLLVSYMRYTVPPDEFGPRDDNWIGSLLAVSPFLRIVEYFSAEIGDGGSQRNQRKVFMKKFHQDITANENDDMNSIVFERVPNAHIHSSVEDVWFDIARQEIKTRRMARHEAEIIPVWEQLPVVLGCEGCYESQGWHA